MLPNPFEKPLPKLEETDPLKNEEIVRSLLGEKGVERYRKILNRTKVSSGPDAVSVEELKALAAELNAQRLASKKETTEWQVEQIISKDYERQMVSLRAIKFLKRKDGILGLKAVDGEFYPAPSEKEIVRYFISIPNIKEKIYQGFTRLLIVPFGRSLAFLNKKTSDLILEHGEGGRLLSESGEKLSFDLSGPVYNQFNNALSRYYSGSFAVPGTGGKLKTDFLSGPQDGMPFPGYNIILLQEDLHIPKEGEGVTRNGRKQIEAGKSAIEYLELLQTDPQYAGERGLAPEDWLTLFATQLYQTNTVIHETSAAMPPTGTAALLIGSDYSHNGDVSFAHWTDRLGMAAIMLMKSHHSGEGVGLITAVG